MGYIYYVVAFFDDETNYKFKKINVALNNNNIKTIDLEPHITLAAYSEIEKNVLVDWISKICENEKSFEVNFNHIGMFGLDVVFLAPRISEELMVFYKKIHSKYDELCGKEGYNYSLLSSNWIPHSTVVMGSKNDVLKSIPIIGERFEPFFGKINKIAIYEYSENKIVSTVELK